MSSFARDPEKVRVVDAPDGVDAADASGASGASDASDDDPVAGGERELDAIEAELEKLAARLPKRLEADPDDVDAGLARLVLTLVEFVRRVLEHQAVRRMEAGNLSDDEIERLGLALLRLEERLEELRDFFDLSEEDLNVDLGPLGRLI